MAQIDVKIIVETYIAATAKAWFSIRVKSPRLRSASRRTA